MDALKNEGIVLTDIDLGGGFGVTYDEEPAFDVTAWGRRVKERLSDQGLRLSIEPGRFLTANAGVLLTRVEYLKMGEENSGSNEASSIGKHFAVVDAAMNDLLRPSLYQAWHGVLAVKQPNTQGATRTWDIVGPICESGDWLAKNRQMSLSVGDLLCVLSAGAYGSTLSSNYNTRPRAAEVIVDGGTFRLVRRRESLQDLLTTEML